MKILTKEEREREKLRKYYNFLEKYLKYFEAKKILEFGSIYEKSTIQFIDKTQYDYLFVSPDINPIDYRGINSARGIMLNDKLQLAYKDEFGSHNYFASNFDLSSFDTLVTVGLSNMKRHVNFSNPRYNILWGGIVSENLEDYYGYLYGEAKDMLEDMQHKPYELIKEKSEEDVIYLIRKKDL